MRSKDQTRPAGQPRQLIAPRTKPRGAPEELVGTLLLLCSPAGEWITGQTIHIDGGWIMRP